MNVFVRIGIYAKGTYMAGSLVGVDIGSGSLKLAIRKQSGTKLYEYRMPENLMDNARVVAPETMSEFMHKIKRENHITATECALVLSSATTYFRQIDIPAMTEDELKLNLPYEFRDYVTDSPDSYFYDYVVRGTEYDEDSKPVGFSLYAAAVLKETVSSYSDILRKAGFRLKLALPRTMVFMNMLAAYLKNNPMAVQQEYCLIDIGYQHTSVDFFRGDDHVASKVIEVGCKDIDDAIVDARNVDVYTAGTYRTKNYDNVLDEPDCERVYSTLAVEILKVINFYNFSTPDNTLNDLYFCGSGSQVEGLTNAIDSQTEMAAHSISELLPSGIEGPGSISICALAYMATIEP